MKVKIPDIRNKMKSVLLAKGYSKDNVDFLIDMYLGGELRGHTSHGLASFPGFAKDDFSKLEKPEVIKSTNALVMIDAKSNPGAIVGKQAADEAINIARKEGVGTAIIKNMDSWLRPGAIAQYIANQDFVAIVINDGGGASTAPPGGYDAVVATNPIAYGIPTATTPLVVDMATAKRAWGQVRLANKYGTDLPADTYYDDKGKVTVDPKEATSVKPFGDYKGFSLALFIEILCGSLVGMKNMMMNTGTAGSTYGTKLEDRGGFILVIDPTQTADLVEFKRANTELIANIKAGHALPGEEIRIPGEHASTLYEQYKKSGEVDISKELWEEIESL